MKYSRHQRGSVAVTVAMTLPILLVAMGWALDFGHVFVNKTRLQNALDATALSAAIAINGDVTHNYVKAEIKGRDTFDLFIQAEGNNYELGKLKSTDLVFDYSKTLPPTSPGWTPFTPKATDSFIFVRVTSTNMKNVTPLFIKAFNFFNTDKFNKDIPVPAVATAGPVGQNCTNMPFIMCAKMPADTVCGDGACYGYTIGTVNNLYPPCLGNNCPPVGPGNFNLLDVGSGAKDIYNALISKNGINNCLIGLKTQPGLDLGQVVKGINDRFDSDTQTDTYPLTKTIKGVTTPVTYNPSPYNQYNVGGKGNNRRRIAVPLADCTGVNNGVSTLPKVGTGCLFLTDKAINGTKIVMAEFIGSCSQNGVFDPTNAVLNGPYKIVLFKSPVSGDS